MAFLETLWLGLLLVAFGLFIILDGADLGIGLLSLSAKGSRRSQYIDAIGPTWYANETWLVIAGAILFAAFPAAYSTILSSLYVPVLMVLFGLIFRAASTELRGRGKGVDLWEIALGVCSLVAVLGLGLLLGGLLAGVTVEDGLYAGPFWGWLNVTSILTACTAATVFVTLGVAHLIGNRETGLPPGMGGILNGSSSLALVLYAVLLAALLVRADSETDGIIQMPRLVFVLAPATIAIVSFILILVRSARDQASRSPYALCIVALLGIGGSLVSVVFPYLVPYSVTFENAASSPPSLVFALFGTGLMIPVVIFYNVYIRRLLGR